MPNLTVIGNKGTSVLPFSSGSSVREILEAAGIHVRSGCRGNGACGFCLVQVKEGTVNAPSAVERLTLSPDQFKKNLRLACQVMPQKDLLIRLRYAVSGEPVPDESQGGWNMSDVQYGNPRLFEAFVKSAQYIVRLKTQQDVWDHLGKFITTHFPADWTAFVQRDPLSEISIHHSTLPDVVATVRILSDEVRALVWEVLESGFLASRVILTPEPSMTVFLPVAEGHRTGQVMLIGHKAVDPLPNALLNIYLAMAGLAGATSERLQNERELNKDRDHLEELVKERTSELAAVNTELEAFSYSVSHDLRAPLRSISGFSQALREEYANKLDATGIDYLKRVLAGCHRMDELINDLLNLSRVSRSDIQFVRVDLSALARSIADDLSDAEPERKVEFVIQDGLFAVCDERLMIVALENLLGNAWKFTGKRSRGIIEFGQLDSEFGPAFIIKDNGAGFDNRHAGKLFTSFHRLHTQEEFFGTGIGLATVKRIITRHGGKVWAEGQVEKGATIFFTLGALLHGK
jgi:signal transduction histidine kinase/ferredoxin